MQAINTPFLYAATSGARPNDNFLAGPLFCASTVLKVPACGLQAKAMPADKRTVTFLKDAGHAFSLNTPALQPADLATFLHKPRYPAGMELQAFFAVQR